MSDERWGKFFLTAEQEGRRHARRTGRGPAGPGPARPASEGGKQARTRSREEGPKPRRSSASAGQHRPWPRRASQPSGNQDPESGKAAWRSPFTDADGRPAPPSQLLSREVWEQRSWFRGKKGGRERGRGSTRQKVLIRLDRRLCRCWLTAVVSIGCVRARLAVPAWRARVARVCAPVGSCSLTVVWKSDREGPQPRNSAI